MHEPLFVDLFDWHGCEAVRFDPEKLGGRATVLETRMDADGVLSNFRDGMTLEEISEDFGVDLDAVRTILAFAEAHDLQERPQSFAGHAKSDTERFDFVISPWSAGIGLTIRHEDAKGVTLTGAGIWKTVAKAQEIAQETVSRLLHPEAVIQWDERAQ